MLSSLLISFSGCNSGSGTGSATTNADTYREPIATTAVPDPTDISPDSTGTEEPDLIFAEDPLDIEVNAHQAFVYNLNTDEFLYMKGKGEKLEPASTTKLLTIVYALTLLAPDELITPSDELSMVGEFSTIAYVRPNHTLTAEMLAEGMLLPSGNDAAHVLAAGAGRKLAGDSEMSGVEAVGVFMEGMNKYAAAIGMTGSHFVTPDGYPTENHYTTVEDMAIISAMAAKNSVIMKYSRLQQDDVVYASGHTNTWVNTNKLLDQWGPYYSPYATGLKTGSVGEGNYALIATADIEGVTYIIGFFSEEVADNRYVDALAVIQALEDRL